MVKLIICAKRKTGMTRKEFDAYWQNQHGPLVKSVPEFMLHVRRYVQCHIVENSVLLGVAAPYDGVAELWFDSAQEIAQAFNEPRYLEIIHSCSTPGRGPGEKDCLSSRRRADFHQGPEPKMKLPKEAELNGCNWLQPHPGKRLSLGAGSI